MSTYKYDLARKALDGATRIRELERLVSETLEDLGRGWALHSVVPLPHNPLDSRLKDREAKPEALLAQRVDDYLVIFEGP